MSALPAKCGAVAEWSKALAWKVSIRQNRIEGSNPSRSATSLRLRSAVRARAAIACNGVFLGAFPKMYLDRRAFLGFAGAAAAGGLILFSRSGGAAPPRFSVNHTPAEWQKILGPQRYAVLREAAT